MKPLPSPPSIHIEETRKLSHASMKKIKSAGFNEFIAASL
jgi:hypothetical protein